MREFRNELNQRIEYFKNAMGKAMTEDQLKNFGVYHSVFDQLVARKLMVQEATRQSRVPSEEEVKSRIQQIQAFQKSGQFDFLTYKRVLEANQMSPGAFEKMMREDLAAQKWQNFFKDRVKVTEDELKKHFLISGDKRNVKYVLLTAEAGKKAVVTTPDEVKKFLADQGKVNIAKAQYEAKKETEYKGKNFDDLKETLAKSIISGEKFDEIRKANEKIAEQILPLLKAEKSADAKVNAILKPYDVEVKTTGMVSRMQTNLPGIGEARDLTADLFKKNSPIDPAQGGRAKKYQSAGWLLVAIVNESQKPDLALFSKEQPKLLEESLEAKERALFSGWMKQLREKASIDTNPDVVGGGTPTDSDG